jgi:hypothetical protein
MMCCNCKTCQHFIADKVGDGSGIGRCRVYASTPDAKKVSMLYRLGADGVPVFWGGDGVRDCEFFEVG